MVSVSISVFFLAALLLRQSKNHERTAFTGQGRFSHDRGDDTSAAAGNGNVLPVTDFVRRRLTAYRGPGLKDPSDLEIFNILAIDVLQRAEAPILIIPAIHQPA